MALQRTMMRSVAGGVLMTSMLLSNMLLSNMLLSSMLALPAHAQSAGPVRVLIRSTSGTPIVGAQLRSSAPQVAGESDESGVATIPKVAPGALWIRVRRIGYRPDSLLLSPTDGHAIDTALTLERVAVDLAPVRVLGRRSVTGPMAGFYARQQSGSGRFFTNADIAQRSPQRMTDLFRAIPGVRIESRGAKSSVRLRGSRCSPLVWLDGQPMFTVELDLDSFDPLSFDGIEVYNVSSVPVEFSGNQVVSSSCGTIVLWTRSGEARNRGDKRKKGELSAAARVAQLLEEQKVFTANDVDFAARLDSASIVRPDYPDSLFLAQVGGRVLAEFVVGSNGSVQLDTYSAVTTTSPLLVEPVRRALKEQRFTPAVRQGKPVQQIMQLPFDFVPDSTAKRRRP